MIDRKYKILAINPCSGQIHTEDDAVLFCAKDAAFPYALEAYIQECKHRKCGHAHIESAELLLGRVRAYQKKHGYKLPDTHTPCEIDRCIGGII